MTVMRGTILFAYVNLYVSGEYPAGTVEIALVIV